jgi:dTDP-4-amino-4,6-dideoxygalactose transaminase
VAAVPHNRLTYGAAEEEAVRAVVASGYWAGGPRVRELEAALAAALGRREAACVGSGVAALRLALRALGVGAGDRVLVPAYACVALPNAVAALGAEPVAVDVEPETWTIDPAAAAAAGPAAAVLAVHTFGAPAAVAELAAAGAPVVDDAAHGLPPGVPPADATITSFYATKLVGGAEGGAVLSDDAAVAAFARAERDYTDRPLSGERLNDKMNDLEAALTLAQLRRLPALLAARDALAARYAARLAGQDALALPPQGGERVWYRYAVAARTLPAAELVARLREHGVVAERPVTDWRDAAQRAATPVASQAYDRVVSLPLFPTLTRDEQDRVVGALERAL